MNDCWAGGYGHCRLAGTLKLAVGGGGPMCWGVLIEHYHPTGVKALNCCGLKKHGEAGIWLENQASELPLGGVARSR